MQRRFHSYGEIGICNSILFDFNKLSRNHCTHKVHIVITVELIYISNDVAGIQQLKQQTWLLFSFLLVLHLTSQNQNYCNNKRCNTIIFEH